MFCKLSINSLKFAVTPEKVIFHNFVLNRAEGISRYSTANKLKYDQNTFAEQFNNDFNQASAYPTAQHVQCLRSKFGIDHFKSPQWRVINSLMEEKRDNFVIMPSGYGKSLCYQFPAVFTNGLTVVISPLISLMQDQVKSLQALNIPACFLGPAQPDKTVYQKLLNGHYRIVYITAESALSVNGLDLLETLHYQVKITLIAIDEAHCILHWGNDFRPAYGNLDILRMKLPSVPVIALTATATREEKYGIFHMLALRNPQEVCSGYDRTNLYFMTREMTKEPYGDISKVLYEDKKRYSIEDGSVIIYCLTKKGTEKLAHLLNGMGIVCRAYHAGLNNVVRKSIMDDFISGETKVIVATTAFGMGINKLDVRIVIHYGTSLSIEGYYQEVGRAGRDGKPALCVMYHSLADFVTHRYINVANSKSETTYCSAEMRNNIMKRYVSTTLCKRQFIGNHFDKTSPIAYPAPQSCCDNCSNNNGYPAYLHDLTDDVELFLRGIQSFHPKSFGPNMIVSLLMGSTDKNKLKFYKDNAYFGTGAKRSEQWWKQIAFILEMEKYIKITNIIVGSALFSKVILDAKGKEWLRDKFNNKTSPIKLPLSKEMQQLLNNKIS